MNIFIAVPTESNPALRSRIESEFPSDSYALPNGEWLIAFGGTTKELSDRLGVSQGQCGAAVVLSVANYWGFADKNLWEWIAVKEKQA
jgi:hypothetical protein